MNKPKKKKKPTFSKKDWREITDRAFCALAISMMTQAFKVGLPLSVKDIPTSFVPIVPPFTKPTTKTPNPGAKKLRKRLGI